MLKPPAKYYVVTGYIYSYIRIGLMYIHYTKLVPVH